MHLDSVKTGGNSLLMVFHCCAETFMRAEARKVYPYECEIHKKLLLQIYHKTEPNELYICIMKFNITYEKKGKEEKINRK